jgi:acetolactate decarboxylase
MTFDLTQSLSHKELLAALDQQLPDAAPSAAVRLDGHFNLVRARSVPRQEPPYRPLTDVVGEQHVFELTEVEGTMMGFRFPDYAEGIEVNGYHLHFITADRVRGGHVLDSRATGLSVGLDPSSDLHIELPRGIELAATELAGETHAALDRVERGG